MGRIVTRGSHLQPAGEPTSTLTLGLLLGLLGGSVSERGISTGIHGLVGTEDGGQLGAAGSGGRHTHL